MRSKKLAQFRLYLPTLNSMENVGNTYLPHEEAEQNNFKFNFINSPWDNRTQKSKIGIISLLLSIFVATFACSFGSLWMHYRETTQLKPSKTSKLSCQVVEMDNYPYVVRIHLAATNDLICVGALIYPTAVLTNGACTKTGTIRLRLGNNKDPPCKKGFSVDIIESIQHEGVISKSMVLLYSYERIADCSQDMIKIGINIKPDVNAYIIGRTVRGERTLSRQPVVSVEGSCSCSGLTSSMMKFTICVRAMVRCPILAGDLLVYEGKLYGLSSTSIRHMDKPETLACFADLKVIRKQLQEFDIMMEANV